MLQIGERNKNFGISVIIPVYNKVNYLKKSINSVLESTYKDVEIICIDDGSNDGSSELLREIVKLYPFIKLITNDENKGVAFSRNVGIDNANGKYIVFLDADDSFDQKALEHYYNRLEQTGAEGCVINIIDNEGNSSIRHLYEGTFSGKELIYQLYRNKDNFLYACGSIWSADFIRTNELSFKELRIGEGGLFILDALLKAKSVIVDIYPGYLYFRNETSTCNSVDSMQYSAIGQLHQIVCMIQNMECIDCDEKILLFIKEYLMENIGGIANISDKNLTDYYSKINVCQRFIAGLVRGEYIDKELTISRNEEAMLKSFGCVCLYGAGYETLPAIRLCNRLGIEIKGIYVSDNKNNCSCVYGYPVKVFGEHSMIDNRIPFLITAHMKHHAAIEMRLKEAGIINIIKAGE